MRCYHRHHRCGDLKGEHFRKDENMIDNYFLNVCTASGVRGASKERVEDFLNHDKFKE